MAICDQVEDPALAKGIVRREVTETVTPGTVLADALLPERRNNYLAALVDDGLGAYALAALDVSTGELTAQRVPPEELAAELGRLEPSEVLLPRGLEGARVPGVEAGAPALTYRDDWMFEADVGAAELLRAYGVQSLEGFGFQAGDAPLARAAGALVQYLREVRPGGASHLRPVSIRRPGRVMLPVSYTHLRAHET